MLPFRSEVPDRPRIAHVSADFPDPVDPGKTVVIRTLLELTGPSFDHRVVSLNRRNPGTMAFAVSVLQGAGRPDLKVEREPFTHGEAWRYGAPARGMFHETMMKRLGERIAQSLCAEASRPDLLIGHKLSVEGLAVRHAARLLGCRYALSIQGDTDTKILNVRRDLRRSFARVFHEAEVVFPFAPWALEKVEQDLGSRGGRGVRMLPCPTDLDVPCPPVNTQGKGGFITAFHLRNRKRKNLDAMMRACDLLTQNGMDPGFVIAGGGSEADLADCRRIVGTRRQVHLEGAMGREALRTRMNAASAFVMPSRRESFGLVFIEALFAGIPVIYPRAAAIDGYFADAPFAMAVDAADPADIARAMRLALEREREIKAALADWHASDNAKRFQRPQIADQFAEGLLEALTPRPDVRA